MKSPFSAELERRTVATKQVKYQPYNQYLYRHENQAHWQYNTLLGGTNESY